MRVPKIGVFHTATAVAFVAAVAGITGILAGEINFPLVGGSAQQEAPVQPAGNLLLTANRDRLAICVSAVGFDSVAAQTASDLQVQGKAAVESVLTGLTDNAAWIRSNLSQPAPVVDTPCPSQPGLYDSTIPGFPRKSAFDLVGRTVTQPSYRVLVYILPSSEIDRLAAYPFSSEERMCFGDACAEVTTGLYLSPLDISDPVRLADLLRKAIGLEPAY